VYIGDSQNHVIRKVESGVISTFAAVTTPIGMAFDGAGILYAADTYTGQIARVSTAGVVTPLPIVARDVAVGTDGSLYTTDGSLVRRSPPTGNGFVVIAGRGDPAHGDFGPATYARLAGPAGLAVSSNGDLYIADTGNYRVRRVQSDGTITTIAGTGIAGDGGDGGLATLASMQAPVAITIDSQDVVYIAQKGTEHSRVRKFSASGAMLAVADTPNPSAIAADRKGNVYIADRTAGKIFRATAAGGLLTIAAGLRDLQAVAVAPDGSLYYVNQAGTHLGHIALDGTTSEVIAPTRNLTGVIAVLGADAAPTVYVVDANYRQVLRMAGDGTLEILPLDDFIGVPSGIVAGPNGVLYVSDSDGGKVWAIEPVVDPPQVTQAVNVLNGASGLPGAIAPGMLVILSGAALQTTSPQVTIGGLPTLVLSMQNGLIVVQAPVGLATGDDIRVELREDRSGASTLVGEANVVVRDAVPTLFTNGRLAYTVWQALAVNEDNSVNGIAQPASLGSVVVLYGTGQGVTGQDVTVTMGGYGAEVLYAGPAPGFPGLLQINARVPESIANLATSQVVGAIEVSISVGDAASPSGTDIVIR
jgi:uncharacterized protein (TIGR03437 family)